MSNEQKFEITVIYPEWTQGKDKYAPFGVKYLFITSVIPYPEWDEDDERWFTYDELDVVYERFIKWYEKNIKDDFLGEILFIEPSKLVVAKDNR